MTSQGLDAIRARDAAYSESTMKLDRMSSGWDSMLRDRRALLAEVDRLTADIGKLVAQRNRIADERDGAENSLLVAASNERARIRAGVEGLYAEPGFDPPDWESIFAIIDGDA